MNRGTSIVLLLLVLLGVGFLSLIWIDMRHSHDSMNQERRSGSQTTQAPAARRREPRSRESREGEPSSRGGEGSSQERQEESGQQACGVACASTYFAAWTWPADGSCQSTVRNGYPEPDGRCTPGGVVPGITAETLRDPDWRTRCIRNCQSSEKQKHVAYQWYGVPAPDGNMGANQVCELDHLVPLELGGADGLGNIWPECGPDGATLRERYFKQKDVVENYLAARVKAGDMPLDEAQRGIATDWVQYLEPARARCKGNRC